MAATVYANGQMDGHHQSSVPSHGPEPGSPTLTNPDMILPDYEAPDSPQGGSDQPSLRIWEDPNAAGMDFQLPSQNFGSRAMPLSTPIIYGNGTMLSDIGEVTEAESTVGPSSRRASSRYSVQLDDNETYGPSGPSAIALAKAQQWKAKLAARERRSSSASTSTVTTEDFHYQTSTNVGTQNHPFYGFDDSASVDDMSFQGDDEESMASSYVEGFDPRNRRGERKAQLNAPMETPMEAPVDDKFSTNYISDRAEKILANAKRRLTAMEGNLTRARSSLAYSPNSGESTPSPPIGRSAALSREQPTSHPPLHSRIRSEDGTRDLTKPNIYPRRASSALGSVGGYRDPLAPARRLETTPRSSAGLISQHPLDTALETLSEDESAIDDASETDPTMHIARESGILSPAFSTYSDKCLNRSASAAQMRDLQDQMHDLKGKISSLREQARVDSMKRRSLQSLRTPSPFTHARWEPGLMEPREIKGIRSGEGTPRASWVSEGRHIEVQTAPEVISPKEGILDMPTPILDGEDDEEPDTPRPDDEDAGAMTPTAEFMSRERGAHTNADLGIGITNEVVSDEDANNIVSQENDDLHLQRPESANQVEEEFDEAPESPVESVEWASESGDSLYHDSFQDQQQLSHEDREDAFDYEHFFLHSAMGSISRQRSRRDDAQSDFSDDSVETTRGPVTSALSRGRRHSLETISSVDTFATATEGRASRSSAFQSPHHDDEDSYYMDNGEFEQVPKLDENNENAGRRRQDSALYRPTSAGATRMHRPSTSSFESMGTNRSFPLVGKTKVNGGVLTPSGSPDDELLRVSESLMSDTASICETDDEGQRQLSSTAQLQNLAKEDQIAVERLVASLGKCVLALGENSRAGAESRLHRRRIDVARRILEGLEDPA